LQVLDRGRGRGVTTFQLGELMTLAITGGTGEFKRVRGHARDTAAQW
jgi:hypothetical protein